MRPKRIERLDECNEVAGNQSRSLMDQLIEGMLAIGARFAPINWAGFAINFSALQRDSLAVAFHCELLQIGGKSLQVLLVGQNRDGGCTQEIVIPNGN